jgi:hypothetical protein
VSDSSFGERLVLRVVLVLNLMGGMLVLVSHSSTYRRLVFILDSSSGQRLVLHVVLVPQECGSDSSKFTTFHSNTLQLKLRTILDCGMDWESAQNFKTNQHQK